MTNEMAGEAVGLIVVLSMLEILIFGSLFALCELEDKIALRIFSVLNVIAVITESVILCVR